MGLEEEVGRLRLAHMDCVALVKSLQNDLATGKAITDSATHLHEISQSRGYEDSPTKKAANPLLNPQIGLEFVMK